MPPASSAEQAVQTHLKGLWRYLRMHGASPEQADDLAQESFAIAVQKGALGFDPPATAAFLRRTARFLLLRSRRNRRDAVVLADEVDLLWQRDCADDDGDTAVDTLRRCVDELTPRAQRAIAGTYGLGSAEAHQHELAAELGLQPNGLKTLLQRARQQLRACVERRQR